MEKYTFEILPSETPTELYDQTIEMSGGKSTFTLNKIFDHIDFTEGKMKEAIGQTEVNQGLITALEEKLPMLKEITPEMYRAVIEYIGKKTANEEYAKLIPTCEQTLASYKERLQQINAALGIEMPKKYLGEATPEPAAVDEMDIPEKKQKNPGVE